MSGFWHGEAPLLLASTSAARLKLLRAAGLPVDTEAPGIDEPALAAGLPDARPDELAQRLADAKALAVSGRRRGRTVLGGDQVLACAGAILFKPADAEAAVRQLGSLQGRAHTLWSAWTLARDGAVLAQGAVAATLSMRALDEAACRRYVAEAGEAALRSVGGYEIEGLGVHLFEGIEGEHTTIVGLPMLPLLAALRRLGLVSP